MKKALVILLVALLAGVATFCLTRSHRQADEGGVLLDTLPELEWLRRDLALTNEQHARVCDLHTAYRPQCEEMCRRLADAHARLKSIVKHNRGMTPELAQAVRDHARIHAESQERMLEHLYQTAALLDDKQAERYLQTVLPYVLDPTSARNGGGHAH